MSAAQTDDPVPAGTDKQLWKFAQKVPIPSYLVAIVAGRLKGKLLGLNSKVYSEPELIEKCVYEFGEVNLHLTNFFFYQVEILEKEINHKLFFLD